MKIIKAVWKGDTSKRIRLKGEGYSATFHFVPGQEVTVPEGALKKLKDDILCERLVILQDGTGLLNDRDRVKKGRFSKKEDPTSTMESSITDSVGDVR